MDVILKEYRKPENFNSYLDLCFGSGNLSVHVLEALGFFESEEAKIKDNRTVIFNDKNKFANWDLGRLIKGIKFIKKDVFTADFLKHICNFSSKKQEKEPDVLSLLITYLEKEQEILEDIRNYLESQEGYKCEIQDNKIKLKKGNRIRASVKTSEILLSLLGKDFEFDDDREDNQKLIEIFIAKTKEMCYQIYQPHQFDFITANFLIQSSEDDSIGAIRLDERKKIILNVIFEHFLSEKGIFLFIYKAKSEKDFEELKEIFGSEYYYITVFGIPELTNELNFILKQFTQETFEGIEVQASE